MEQQKQADMIQKKPPQTQMTAPQTTKKMVKIVALRQFMIPGTQQTGADGKAISGSGTMSKINEILEVSEEVAADLCKPLHGHYAFSGERYEADKDTPVHMATRARMAKKRDLVPDEEVD